MLPLTDSLNISINDEINEEAGVFTDPRFTVINQEDMDMEAVKTSNFKHLWERPSLASKKPLLIDTGMGYEK